LLAHPDFYRQNSDIKKYVDSIVKGIPRALSDLLKSTSMDEDLFEDLKKDVDAAIMQFQSPHI
jgi:hypothetical protein